MYRKRKLIQNFIMLLLIKFILVSTADAHLSCEKGYTDLSCKDFVSKNDWPHDEAGEPKISTASMSGYYEICYKKADEVLNRFYDEIMRGIDDNINNLRQFTKSDALDWKKGLRNAQRGWIKYKENECRIAEYHFWGGNGIGSASIACRAEITLERLNDWTSDYSSEWCDLWH